jgi:Ca-activated chloride channel family protein
MKLRQIALLSFLLLAAIIAFSQAQDQPIQKPSSKETTRILFVFDASQSMYGRWQSDMKINIARKILIEVLDSLKNEPDLELGLRLYGHQFHFPPQVCEDSKLEVPFAKDNFDKIKNRLNNLVPKGTTPIAYALEQCINDFTPCDNCRNVIVLITDGIEECDGDPCEASLKLQKNGFVLKPFIIGIGTNFEKAFNCVGIYFDASSEEKFSSALNVVVSRVLNPTTCQVNLLDANNRPTETNINMTFYDHLTSKIKYNFIHTLNSHGLPDTLNIDPLLTYDIQVHTIPPVRIDSIRLNPARHNIIPINVPQGILVLKLNSQNENLKSIKTIIRKQGSGETINVQDLDKHERYLTGTYSIEILSLPRIYQDNIAIMQSHTTTVDIPVPGIAVIQKQVKGYGSLFVNRDDDIELIYNFRDTEQQESLVLMPGNYTAVFRSRFADRSSFTIEKSFEVKSGITTIIKLQD